MRLRRALLFLAIAAAQFALFETALRVWGHSEAAPAFQAIFMPDPVIGYRLRPGARTRFVTAEFDTEIAINAQGVRDDGPIGPKPANERRIIHLELREHPDVTTESVGDGDRRKVTIIPKSKAGGQAS